MNKSYDEWVEVIGEEVDYVDVKPFSHNIISIALSAIAKEWGNNTTNRVIEDFGLEDLGWQKRGVRKPKQSDECCDAC